jgi:hypothetical protein
MTAKPTTLLAAMQVTTRALSRVDIELHNIDVHGAVNGDLLVEIHVPNWDTFETVADLFGFDLANIEPIGAGVCWLIGDALEMKIKIYGPSNPAAKVCHCFDKVAS